MTAEYAANMEDDLDWAMDWSRSDSEYSRNDNRWVTDAISRGLRNAFNIGIPFREDTLNPLNVFAGSSSGGGGEPRNYDPKGTVHPKTFGKHKKQVSVSMQGFPLFDKFVYKNDGKRGDVRGIPKTTPAWETAAANAKLGLSITPKGFIWHHHQNHGRMQLVPKRTHKGVGHTGRAYW